MRAEARKDASLSVVIRAAAGAGPEHDIQVTGCGTDLPLRSTGRPAPPYRAYRGGFSPPPDGVVEPGYREWGFGTVDPFAETLQAEASRSRWRRLFVGFFGGRCGAFGFSATLANGERIDVADEVRPWK